MKSLKLVVLITAIALVPLGLGVMVLKQSEQAQLEQDAALESEAAAATARLRDSIAETRATVLITAHNPSFRDFYRSGNDRYATIVRGGPTMDRVNGALLYLAGLYPDSIVQASFVDGGGAENARIVRGSREAPQGLTEDVSRDSFFRPALALAQGRVHQSRPHVSRHAGEWVVSYSTRVPRQSGAALVHVEQRVESLRRALGVADGRFEIAVIDAGTGAVLLDSGYPQQTGSELGQPADSRFRRLAGAAGDGVRTLAGLRAVYRPLRASADAENDWIVVASAPRVRAASLIGVNSLPIALALLGVVLIGAVMARRWVRTSKDALTDALTGLGNRRKLVADLERELPLASPVRPLAVMLYDLDGFKLYNDAFGHPAGDALLARLGQRLHDAIGGSGSVYRLGGDEFCVVSQVGAGGIERLQATTVEALTERGDGFDVGSSCGGVVASGDVKSVDDALRAADQRLYACKASGRRSAGRQAADALLQALHERQPELHDHLHGVGDLVAAVGERLGLAAEELDLLRQAGELHDVGKMAIPDSILSKPGSLDDQEWTFVRQHPLVGERIISAAPALAQVGKLVRASHERFDGTGYPDGRAGEEIPLGARIIAVCDAYDAMIGPRPYRLGMSEEGALDELRRCSGEQFDPAVVDVFCELRAETRAEAQRSDRAHAG
ncbi:MAG: HD domain-containing phosphohydrolase [Gaiellaceae bacterium]